MSAQPRKAQQLETALTQLADSLCMHGGHTKLVLTPTKTADLTSTLDGKLRVHLCVVDSGSRL
eukprot:COSAG02_NODE_664_length_18739_cov_11.071567_10_plen_63_part_00